MKLAEARRVTEARGDRGHVVTAATEWGDPDGLALLRDCRARETYRIALPPRYEVRLTRWGRFLERLGVLGWSD